MIKEIIDNWRIKKRIREVEPIARKLNIDPEYVKIVVESDIKKGDNPINCSG